MRYLIPALPELVEGGAGISLINKLVLPYLQASLDWQLRLARKIWPGFWVVLLLALACSASATQVVAPTATSIPTNTVAPTPTVQPTLPAPTTPAEPVLTVGDATFTVEVADTSETRSRGLSGHPPLEDGSGMLFVFESESRFVFWMREMLFPLDFVWIGSDCSVADLTEDVPEPPPESNLSDLPRYQPAVPVQYILEINAGAIKAAGISKGDPVGFAGSITGLYGC